MSSLRNVALNKLANDSVKKGVLSEVFQASGLFKNVEPDSPLAYFQNQLLEKEAECFRLAEQIAGSGDPQFYADDNEREGAFNGLYSRVQIVEQLKALEDEPEAAALVSRSIIANPPSNVREVARFMVDRNLLLRDFAAAGLLQDAPSPEWQELTATIGDIEAVRMALSVQLVSSGTSSEIFKADDNKAGFYNGMYSRMELVKDAKAEPANDDLSYDELLHVVSKTYGQPAHNFG